MTEDYRDSLQERQPYIPQTLSEIYDMLASLMGGAPTFAHPMFPERTIHSEFRELDAGLAIVRKKLGEKRYAAAIDLSARAKALFLEDQEERTGKTMEGIKLFWQLEEIIQDARNRRSKARLKDDEGRVTGD
jgi:hypothetical protein